ncbi:MAG TPA: mechanosensitive ion channel family protein [Longimicrobiales bacterium]|nr:mechanosensitive ion channel family protein [Longimicrobiales bacterium]
MQQVPTSDSTLSDVTDQAAQVADSLTANGFDLTASAQAALGKVTGWVEALVASLPEIIAAVVVLVLFAFLARAARAGTNRLMRRATDHGPLRGLTSNATYVAVLGTGVFVALGVLQLDTVLTSALAGVGIVGLALGFAFQDIAQNFVSGILITLRRPFTDGDLVETNGFRGRVEGVDLRATRIRSLQGQLVRIPNGSVYGNPIVNFDQGSSRRVDLSCGTSYGDDLEKARRVALDAMKDVEGRDPNRDPEFYYKEFGGSSIDFVVRFWLRGTDQGTYLTAQSDAIMKLKAAFDENDVGIPFPITTLDFSDAGTRRLDEPLRLLRSESRGDDAGGRGD